ncbi:MAG: DUF447 family protein [Methanobrevibacter sp.]|uniref:DUF447 domain-containing protein n=1 Tax=Methanobrevibacter sp. TaxID=66852 RepID=UPI0026E05FA5|nr:DUF447 domain-containing protein [Methanobrevibacter sp.]MDO5848719.1 DUF447 family protein [Methanobrevibacter sp.]
MNLERVGIKPQLKYECIYTTISKDGKKDAAPIGFTYLGNDKVKCSIFEDAQTLKNILDTRRYVVNITQDPMAFAYATIANVPEDYYTNDESIAILKDAPSYLVIDVEDIEEKHAERYPIENDKSRFEITGKIDKFVVNDDSVKAFNRGMGCLIDSLVNYTRYYIVDDEGKKFFDERLEENQRIINKVADSNVIEAMELLKKNQEK